MLSNKHSFAEVLFQRASKTTINTLYDKGSLDSFRQADKVLNIFLFVKRRRPGVEELKIR